MKKQVDKGLKHNDFPFDIFAKIINLFWRPLGIRERAGDNIIVARKFNLTTGNQFQKAATSCKLQ
jgi:hypothetical protein